MTMIRVMQSLAVALLVAIASSAPVASQPAAPPQPYCGAGYGNGVMGFLTPEQRMVHFAEMRKATAEMSFNDMRDYRWKMHEKVMAMSGAERRAFADDLAAKWNGLSADEKERVRQDFTTYRGNGRWGQGRGMGRGMGMGRGRGMGCWW